MIETTENAKPSRLAAKRQKFSAFANKLRYEFIQLVHVLSGRKMREEEVAISSRVGSNPYLAARTEWNFMYNDILHSKRNWQLAALALMVANILLITGMTFMAMKSRFIPYVVKVDSTGNTAFGGFLVSDQPATPEITNAFVRRYIQNVRNVIADPIAEKKVLDDVYAKTRGESLNFINNYFHAHDPFKHAAQGTVDVQVTAAMQKSPSTWQVDWAETLRNLDGNVVGHERYEGLVTVTHHAVIDEQTANVNPQGLYVSHLSWSQQL